METRRTRSSDEGYVSSAGSRGRVLITQFPDDDSVHTSSHSDARSEAGTLYTHVIDSPIPEESEGEGEGHFSRNSCYSPIRDENADGRESRQSELTTGQSLVDDGGSDSYGRGSEDGEEDDEDGSYVDSMSMDNVSDTFSMPYEPPELKDEDFDTDLEMDDDKWLHPEKYDHDTTGLTKYLNACQEHDVTPVRYFIKHMLEETMNLGHHGLGPAAMKALAVPLESNTSIERLDLEGNWIEDQGVTHLCRVLRENVYIIQLNLAENKMANSGALCVLNLMMENRTIEWLDLTGNSITDSIGETLYDMLKKNTTLRHLKLRHNELSDGGAQWLKEALSDNDNLETLDISWNHFQTRGCVLVAEGIKENVGLKELNLSMNGFGLEGAVGLGEAIKVNRTLRKLDASYCRLPLEGAASLAFSLQVNETLQEIYVGYNSLGPDGTFALLLGLERNDCSGLTLLHLGNSKVTPQFKELQDKLENERPLRVLHGGVMLTTLLKEMDLDLWDAFKKDPMTKLKEWVQRAGYRLIDLLRHFDKDNSMTISREEFINGMKSIRIDITDEEIEILLARLDTDGDGEIDFKELIEGDNDHRSLKREIKRLEVDQKRMCEETETDIAAFLRQSPVPL